MPASAPVEIYWKVSIACRTPTKPSFHHLIKRNLLFHLTLHIDEYKDPGAKAEFLLSDTGRVFGAAQDILNLSCIPHVVKLAAEMRKQFSTLDHCT